MAELAQYTQELRQQSIIPLSVGYKYLLIELSKEKGNLSAGKFLAKKIFCGCSREMNN